MNGIHDMGGMTCFGPVEAEENEPVFHHEWEKRVFALSAALAGMFGPIDARRYALECLDPAFYLRATYYQRWLARLELVAVRKGLLTNGELAAAIAASAEGDSAARVLSENAPIDPDAVSGPDASGQMAAAADARQLSEPPPGPEFYAAVVEAGRPSSRAAGRLDPRFAVGEMVRARNTQPEGHTRLPRYARGRVGMVSHLHGSHVFPDTNAHDGGENPQPLYTVRFAATELWGPEAAPRDTVCIDLWEDHLEPLDGQTQ